MCLYANEDFGHQPLVIVALFASFVSLQGSEGAEFRSEGVVPTALTAAFLRLIVNEWAHIDAHIM